MTGNQATANFTAPQPSLQPVEVWDNLFAVHYNDSLALNVITRDAMKSSKTLWYNVYASFATMERIRKNPAMREEAIRLAREGGVRVIPPVAPIPTHHVGQLLRTSLTVLNGFGAGMPDHVRVLSLREEIVKLRDLLDEAEGVLDTCSVVEFANGVDPRGGVSDVASVDASV